MDLSCRADGLSATRRLVRPDSVMCDVAVFSRRRDSREAALAADVRVCADALDFDQLNTCHPLPCENWIRLVPNPREADNNAMITPTGYLISEAHDSAAPSLILKDGFAKPPA